MKKVLIAIVVVLLCSAVAKAFFPHNCNAEHAASDYADAHAVLVGRIIKVERVVSDDKGRTFSTYMAAFKIGRVERSDVGLKAGDEIKLFAGMSEQKGEDNTEPTFLKQCNTHNPPGFVFDGVYVLFLDVDGGWGEHGEDPTKWGWKPRSCHFSTHLMTNKYIKEDNKNIAVIKTKGQELALEDFLKNSKEQAKKAKEAELRKAAEEEKK